MDSNVQMLTFSRNPNTKGLMDPEEYIVTEVDGLDIEGESSEKTRSKVSKKVTPTIIPQIELLTLRDTPEHR